MIETYYAGAYWAARQETAAECGRRAQLFFQAMARYDPLFAHWFVPPRSRKQEPTPLDVTAPALQELFAQRRVLNDDKRIIEDLGFNLSAGNGTLPGSPLGGHVHVRVRCGVYADGVGNACVLSLPTSGPQQERVLTTPMLVELMRAMVLAWDPDWSVATSHDHVEMAYERAIVGTFVGWIMYFSRHLDTLPPLPAPVRVEPIEDKGTLVILTPERFTATSPEHVALAARVHELLSHAGLLKPLL
jgi:hypothetical protein